MSGTTGNVGSQVSTALQGTMDSAAIARLVQQLLTMQNAAGDQTGQAQTGTTNGSAGTQTTGQTQQQTGGTSVSGMNASDYATMMQQLLALLYGRGTSTGGGGGGLESGGGASV